jgi:hypothetical protein
MLLGGDEIGRTQGGNNNAYCQDNEIHDKLKFALPRHRGEMWVARLDTACPDGEPARQAWHAGERYPLAGRSLVLMTQSPE